MLNGLDKRFVSILKRSLYWQVAMLFGLVALLVIPLYGAAPQYHWQTPWNNGQLFSEWLLWAIWYPGTLLSVLVVGRLWCGLLCPLGAMSEWFSRIGWHFSTPAAIKHPLATTVSFVVVTIWAQTLDVRDDLQAALTLFALIFILAAGAGLLFSPRHKSSNRVWCRHLCPIGSILGVFSRLGAINLVLKPRSLNEKTLSSQSVQQEKYRENGLCPTNIDLATKQTARHCIKCARCVNPDTKGGLKLEVRPLATEIRDIERFSPSFSELWFILLAPGLALAGFVWTDSPSYVALRQSLGRFAMSEHWYAWFQSGPSWLMNQSVTLGQHYLWLDFFAISFFMLGWSLALALALLLVSWLGASLFMPKEKSLLARMTYFGYQFAPMAMLGIVLGLGSTLFASLTTVLGKPVFVLEVMLLIVAFVFNLVSGWRWIGTQTLSFVRHVSLTCCLFLGCSFLGVAALWGIFPSFISLSM